MDPIEPYELPLSLEAFRSALAKGQGRVLLDLRQFGLRPALKPLILEAVRRTQIMDPQSEPSRGAWLLQIADTCNLLEDVRAILIEALDAAPGDSNNWETYAVCEMAVALMGRGDVEVARALRDFLARTDASANDFYMYERLKLEGRAALIRIAEREGAWLRSEKDYRPWEDSLLAYDDLHGQGSARAELEEERVVNADIDAFLEFIDAKKEAQPAREDRDGRPSVQSVKAWSLERFLAYVRETDGQVGLHLSRSWGEVASDADLLVILDQLECCEDPTRALALLNVFRARQAPELRSCFFDYTRHENCMLQTAAFGAIENVQSERVREFALEGLRRKHQVGEVLGLLDRNFKPGDHALIEAALFDPEDPHDLHGPVSGLVDLYRKLDGKTSIPALLFAYEHSPCGNCRARSLELLIEAGTVPTWIRDEVAFDAHEDVQDLLIKLPLA